MIRNSLRFTSYKDRKQLVKDLRMIYTAATEEAAPPSSHFDVACRRRGLRRVCRVVRSRERLG
jgi:transposase-like protein